MAETATKQIQFKFVIDQQSFAQVRNALQALTREAEKFSKAMSAGGGLFGGANVGRTGTLSTAQTQAGTRAGSSEARTVIEKAFQGTKEAEKGMGQLSDAVRRGTTSMGRDLQGLDRILQSLGQRFAQMSSSPLGFLRGGLQMMSGQGGGAGIGGTGGGAAGAAASGGIGMLGSFAGGAVAGGAAVYGLAKLYDVYQKSQFANTMVKGELGQVLAAPWERARAYGTPGANIDSLARMTLSLDQQNQVGRWSEGEDNLGTRVQLRMENMGARFKNIFGLMSDSDYNAQMQKSQQEHIQASIEARKSEMGFRTTYGRAAEYYGGHMEDMFAAQAGGLTGGERADQYQTDPKKPWEFGNYDVMFKSQHLSQGAYLAARFGLRAGGGSEATRYADAVALSQRSGFGGGMEVATAAARFGGGGIMGAALGGPLGTQQNIQLAQLSLGTGFEMSGQTNPMGRIAAINSAASQLRDQGMTTANVVSAMQAGVSGANAFFGQTQGIGGMRSVLSAIEATSGQGIGFQGRDVLARASYTDLLAERENQSPLFRAWNLTPQMAGKMLDKKMESSLYSLALGSDQNAPAVKAAKEFFDYKRGHGKLASADWIALQPKHVREEIAAATEGAFGGLGASEAAWAGAATPVGKARKGGLGGIGKFKDVSGKQAEKDAAQAKDDALKAMEGAVGIKAELNAAMDYAHALEIPDEREKQKRLKEIADGIAEMVIKSGGADPRLKEDRNSTGKAIPSTGSHRDPITGKMGK